MQGTWHHDYLWPACWALLIHLAVLLLLMLPVRTPEPPTAVVISSYLYTPPKVIEEVAKPLPELSDPVAPLARPIAVAEAAETAAKAAPGQPVKPTPTTSEVSAQQQMPAEDDRWAGAKLATADANEVPAKLPLPGPGIAERVLAGVTNHYQQPEPNYSGWKQQKQRIPVSRSEPWQQPGATPEQSVLFTYNDGKQLVRVNGLCVIADPTLSGFEQLMKLRGAPCRESDDAVLFRQTMAKWLQR